jgi:hypothetical protein
MTNSGLLAISIYQKQADGKSIVQIFMLFGIALFNNFTPILLGPFQDRMIEMSLITHSQLTTRY